jgi:hypothetical protein
VGLVAVSYFGEGKTLRGGRQRNFIHTVGLWEVIWSRHLERNRGMWMVYIVRNVYKKISLLEVLQMMPNV